MGDTGVNTHRQTQRTFPEIPTLVLECFLYLGLYSVSLPTTSFSNLLHRQRVSLRVRLRSQTLFKRLCPQPNQDASVMFAVLFPPSPLILFNSDCFILEGVSVLP